jgi:hypothetical protein
MQAGAQAPKADACPPEVEGLIAPVQDQLEPEIAGVINGARHPEKIPDHVALRLFLRSLVTPTPEEAPGSAEEMATARDIRAAHERQAFAALELNEKEGYALRAVVGEFGRRVRELDRKAAAVKDASWPEPGPEAVASLERLQGQRDALVREIMRSLPQRLGVEAAVRLSRHLATHVKRRMKVFVGPATSPAERARGSASAR